MSEIWFTADTHFGHPGILIHQSKRLNHFECVEEMDAYLIDQINTYVTASDELWHLGDFCWQASRAGHYRQRLNVRKLYVCQGNHDSNSLRNHVSDMRNIVYRRFIDNGRKFRLHLCHYPLLSWRGLHNGSYHLYGHSHGMYEDQLNSMFPGRRAMDVGVDAIYRLIGEWRPIHIEEIIERLGRDEKPIMKREDRLPGPFGV